MTYELEYTDKDIKSATMTVGDIEYKLYGNKLCISPSKPGEMFIYYRYEYKDEECEECEGRVYDTVSQSCLADNKFTFTVKARLRKTPTHGTRMTFVSDEAEISNADNIADVLFTVVFKTDEKPIV